MINVRTVSSVVLALGISSAASVRAQSVTPVRLVDLVTVGVDSCPQSSPRGMQVVEHWESAVFANERVPGHWYAYGQALYDANRYRESIGAFERAIQLGAGARAGAWNVARAYARLENDKQALRWLATALAAGERGRQEAREEPAFERLRGDARFRELTGSMEASRRQRGPSRGARVLIVADGNDRAER